MIKNIKSNDNTVNINSDNVVVYNTLEVFNNTNNQTLDIDLNGNITSTGSLNCANVNCVNINSTNFSALNLNISGTSNLRGTTTVLSSLNVSGTTNLNNNVNISGSSTVLSSLNVSGTTNLNNNVNINNGNLDMNNGKMLDVSNIDNNGLNLNLSTITDHDITLSRYTGVSLILKNNYISENGDVITTGNQTNNSNLNILGDLNVSGQSAFTGNLNCGYLSASEVFCPNVDYTGTLDVGSTSCTTLNLGCGNHTQTIDIGTGVGTTTINIGGAGDTVNIAGTLNNITSQSLVVSDKNILLNNGAVGSGTARGAGLSIRDNNSDTQAYIQVSNVGTSYDIKAPENNFVLNTGVLSQNETVAYQSALNNISSNAYLKTGGLISGTATVSGLTTFNNGFQINGGNANFNGADMVGCIRQTFNYDANFNGYTYGTWFYDPYNPTNRIILDGMGDWFRIGRNSAGGNSELSYFSISGNRLNNGTILNGATTCASSLDVNNNITVHNVSNSYVNTKTTSGAGCQLFQNTTEMGLFSTDNLPMNLYTNNTRRISILGNGNVGIGTTSALSKLEIDYNNAVSSLSGLTNYGSVHMVPATNSDNTSMGLTFGANDGTQTPPRTNTQAGILCQSSSAYGTKLHFLTTSSYGTGMVNNMTLTENGNLNLNGNLNYQISGVKLNRNVSFGFDGSTTPTLSRIRPSGVSAGITRNGTGDYTINISGPSDFLASSAGVPIIHINTSDHKLTGTIAPAGGNSLDLLTFNNGVANDLVGTTMWISYNYT